jgi:hypothetical protein
MSHRLGCRILQPSPLDIIEECWVPATTEALLTVEAFSGFKQFMDIGDGHGYVAQNITDLYKVGASWPPLSEHVENGYTRHNL